ncbi:hypothetical protein HHI36_006634 [Cryptolaemus montrouzieri]|uniref:Uncharacterized protein n=1 Tax=Cryptolaemus montrouzieri TaxID=559131 RepID=A0ABD2NYG9_9CUCU
MFQASVPFFNCDLKESSKIFLELFPNLCAKDATELIVMKKDLKRSAYWGIVEILHDTTYKEIERILEDHYEVLGVYLDSKEYSKATYIYRQVVERYETVPGLSKNFESDGYLNVYSTGVLDVTGGRTGFLLYEHKLYVANNPRYIDFLKSLVDKNSQCELLPGTEVSFSNLL